MKTRIINCIHLLIICWLATNTIALQSGDFIYDINTWVDTNTVTIFDYIGAGGDVNIPDTIGSKSVTVIYNSAFNNRGDELTSVVIPDSVTYIGERAFQYCSGLTNVVIGSSVTGIGDRAFGSCNGLMDIVIPDSVTYIGNYAFAYCGGLTNIVIPGSDTGMEDSVFRSCSRLVAITVNTNNLWHSSVNGVLFNKDQTSLIRYPGGKTGSYTIPDSVEFIKNYAFAFCSGLTNIVIPDSVTYIEDSAFRNCRGLTAITVDTNNLWYSSKDGVLFDKDQTRLIQYPGGKHGSYTIPDSVTHIGSFSADNAFAHCSGLTNIEIPGSVTDIGFRAFAYCSGLTAITVDTNNPTYSSRDGVLFNKDQTSLIRYPGGKTGPYTIPDNTTRIEAYALAFLSGLTSVTIPDSIPYIDYSVFQNCSGLIAITVSTNNPAYSSVDGVLFDKNQHFLVCYPGGKTGSYTIPDGISSIRPYAFAYCNGLTSVTVPNCDIEAYAFYRCTNLTTIVVANSMYTGGRTFAFCDNLTGIYFKDHVPFGKSGELAASSKATVYYLPGTYGWGARFDGRPTQLWNPSVQTSDGNFGVRGDAFGFNIAGHDSELVKIETCTNLTTGMWTPSTTTNLTAGTAYFSDPDWINHPNRFYRLSMP